GMVSSNGNFHGAPLAHALDFLAIVAADVASMAERRTDRMMDVARNQDLPPFLADDAGVDSGLMIAHYTQAAMGAEGKRGPARAPVPCRPGSGPPCPPCPLRSARTDPSPPPPRRSPGSAAPCPPRPEPGRRPAAARPSTIRSSRPWATSTPLPRHRETPQRP